MKTKPEPGTRVRLTGKFLRNTGQHTGSEGQSRWTVTGCACGLCKNGRHVATDEPGYYFSEDGLMRHFDYTNLQVTK